MILLKSCYHDYPIYHSLKSISLLVTVPPMVSKIYGLQIHTLILYHRSR